MVKTTVFCEIKNVAAGMATIKLRRERCKGCGLCIAVCPKGAIALGTRINRNGYPTVILSDKGSCTGCAICAEMCPDVAILVYK
jgi:2-oxoglutarate ferredoxin oxidoreductase subunit delta